MDKRGYGISTVVQGLEFIFDSFFRWGGFETVIFAPALTRKIHPTFA
jgi:hypothetical protein